MATGKIKNSDTLISRLESLMVGHHLTRADLARALNVSNAHVSNWLGGQQPRAEHLLTIARHFGVTIEWLLTGDGAAASLPVDVNPSRADARTKELKTIVAKLERLTEEVRKLAES